MTAAAGQAQAEASSSSSSSSLSLCCRRGGHCPVLTACAPPFSRPVSPSMASTSSSSDPNLPILILAILGILATAFVLLTYYVIVAKCCTRLDSALRRSSRPVMDVNMNWHVLEDGLEESLIQAIPIIKLKDAVHLHEQNSDCSVCLTEFCEHDLLRMLPKCSHVFHVECIDSWLRSHCSCPLCRAVIVPGSQTCLSTTTGSDDLAAATLDASSSDDPRPRRNDTISDPDLSFLGSISSTRSGAGLCRNQARAVSDLVDRFRHSSRKIHHNSNKDSTCLGLGSSCPERQEQEGSSSFQAGVRRSFSMDSAAFKHYHGHSFAGDVIGSENLIAGSACHFDFGTSSTPSRKHGFLFFGSRGAGPPRNAILPV